MSKRIRLTVVAVVVTLLSLFGASRTDAQVVHHRRSTVVRHNNHRRPATVRVVVNHRRPARYRRPVRHHRGTRTVIVR